MEGRKSKYSSFLAMNAIHGAISRAVGMAVGMAVGGAVGGAINTIDAISDSAPRSTIALPVSSDQPL